MPEHTPAPTAARSLYGVFLYILSNILLIVYCTWAFTPDHILHYFNIYYYPQKYWSFTVPIQLLLALTLFAFIIYPSANLILSPNINQKETLMDAYNVIHDSKENVPQTKVTTCVCQNKTNCMKDYYDNKHSPNRTIPHAQDLNIKFVCKKLYY